MSSPSAWFALAPVLVVNAATPAAATQYLSIAEAQQAMFPAAASFINRSIVFSPAQRKAIAQASGSGPEKSQALWDVRGPAGRQGWLFIDRVLGKHELITYALALDPTGAVKGVEILDYRETYGGEIRNPRWRQQFIGKRDGAALRLGTDIRNISGATLSSRHVTDGIRRLLATFALVVEHG